LNRLSKLQWTQVIQGLAVAALVLLLALQNMGRQPDILEGLNQVLPGTTTYEKITGKHILYKAYRDAGTEKEFLGYGAVAGAAGYAGPITVLVGISPEAEITDTVVMENFETPLFWQKVMAHDYLSIFQGMPVTARIVPQEDVDVVAGATYSTAGIANAVRKAAHWTGESEWGMQAAEEGQTVLTPKVLGLAVLYLLVFLAIRRKSARLRILTLGLGVVFLGFWQKYPLTFANFTTLFSGNVPAFYENAFWHLLVVGVLLGVLLSGRNFYCSHICPFGAVQEGINKLAGFQVQPPREQARIARRLRLPLAWAAFLIALLFHNHSIASFETFSTLFQLQGNQGQWFLMPFVLFVGVFIYRFWCRFFCPVGAVLDLAATLKRRVLKRWEKKSGKSTSSQS